MTLFAVIEDYRRELRALPFIRLGAEQRDGLDHRYRSMHHSNAIEGVHPTPELEALFRMFVEEGVPPAVSDRFVDRYVEERILVSVKASVA